MSVECKTDYFATMPRDPLKYTLEFLSAADLARLGRVNRLFRALVTDPLLFLEWKHNYQVPPFSPLLTWKENYSIATMATQFAWSMTSQFAPSIMKTVEPLSTKFGDYAFVLSNEGIIITKEKLPIKKVAINPIHAPLLQLAANDHCLFCLTSGGYVVAFDYRNDTETQMETAYSKQHVLLKKTSAICDESQFVSSDQALILRYAGTDVMEIIPLEEGIKRVIFNHKIDLQKPQILKIRNMVFLLGKSGEVLSFNCSTKKVESSIPSEPCLTDSWVVADTALFAVIPNSSKLLRFDLQTKTYNQVPALPSIRAMHFINKFFLLCIHEVETVADIKKEFNLKFTYRGLSASLLNLKDGTSLTIYS